MLPELAGDGVPALVGHVDQEVGPLAAEVAGQVCENVLIADHGGEADGPAAVSIRQLEDHLVVAGHDVARHGREGLQEGQQVAQRDILPERHQAYLVVAADEPALRRQEEGAVGVAGHVDAVGRLHLAAAGRRHVRWRADQHVSPQQPAEPPDLGHGPIGQVLIWLPQGDVQWDLHGGLRPQNQPHSAALHPLGQGDGLAHLVG